MKNDFIPGSLASKIYDLYLSDPSKSYFELADMLGTNRVYISKTMHDLRARGYNIPIRAGGARRTFPKRADKYNAIIYCLQTAGKALSASEVASYWGSRLMNNDGKYNGIILVEPVSRYLEELRKLGSVRSILRSNGTHLWMLSDRKYGLS
jgi:biotin operon repressor